jgi:hypothetical protein
VSREELQQRAVRWHWNPCKAQGHQREIQSHLQRAMTTFSQQHRRYQYAFADKGLHHLQHLLLPHISRYRHEGKVPLLSTYPRGRGSTGAKSISGWLLRAKRDTQIIFGTHISSTCAACLVSRLRSHTFQKDTKRTEVPLVEPPRIRL